MQTAEKRVAQLESDSKTQSEQLEELYQQVDSLQEVISLSKSEIDSWKAQLI